MIPKTPRFQDFKMSKISRFQDSTRLINNLFGIRGGRALRIERQTVVRIQEDSGKENKRL